MAVFDLIDKVEYSQTMNNRIKNTTNYGIRNCVFGFECKMDWEAMPSVAQSEQGSTIKFCSNCDKEVYQSVNDDELLENIKLNRCIAIERPTEDDNEVLLGYVTPFGSGRDL